MNKKERNITSISLALFLHFFLLSRFSFLPDTIHSSSQLAEVQIDFSLAYVQDGKSFALESVPEKNSQHEAIRKRLLARKLFLKQVAARVHRLRFLHAKKKLIGTAFFQFKIDTKGRFLQVTLVRSSGKPELDRAARNAILAASGKVKRPPVLGSEVILFSLPVKYQYDLF